MNITDAQLSRRTFLYSSMVAGMVGLTGCSSLGPNEGTDNEGGTASPSNTRATIAQGVDPTTLDPVQQRETTTQNVLLHLYDTLLQRSPDDPKSIVGNLVENYEMTDDVTMALALKPGVTFSDGSPLTSADVVYTFDYLLGRGDFTEPGIAAYQFGTIDSVEADGDLGVTIKTSAPDPLLTSRLTTLYVIKDGVLADDPEILASEPLGTGPYTLDTWERNSQVVLTAREDYHGGAPSIQTVVFRTIPEDSSRLAALKAGDADLITNVPADNVEEIEASGTATVEEVPSTRIASIWLNAIDGGPLAEPKVRLALNHAVDVDGIITHVMSGYGQRVATFVPEYFDGYDPEIQPLAYDPEKARSLLAEAGQDGGFEVTLMVPEGRYPFATEVAQAMIPYFEEVGVTLKLNTVEFGVFASATQARDIGDGFYGAWGNSFFNPLDELNVAVVTGDDGFSWYSNKEVDRLTAEAGSTLDEAERTRILSEIQKLLLEDPPFIFLFAYIDLYGISNRLDFEPRSDESLPMHGAQVTE
jgi:peptide/nickel transport system substrate-binding protein